MGPLRSIRKFFARSTGCRGYFSGKQKKEAAERRQREALERQKKKEAQQRELEEMKRKKQEQIERREQRERELAEKQRAAPTEERKESEDELPLQATLKDAFQLALQRVSSESRPPNFSKKPRDDADDGEDTVDLDDVEPEEPKDVSMALDRINATLGQKKIDRPRELMQAAGDGDLERVQELLARGGLDIDAVDPADGYTALAVAAEQGDVEMIAWLFRHGADIEHKDNDGRTPLFAAAVAGQASAIDYLIREAGAKSDVTDGSGRHVFWATCALGLVQAAAALLDASAAKGLRRININAKDKCGLSALDFALRTKNNDVVKFLKSRDALNATDKGAVHRLTRDWEIRELDAILSSDD